MALFRNFYRCDRCGHEWAVVWSATCDDDCPACGARHMSPCRSEDVPEDDELKVETASASLSTADRIRQLNDSFRQTFVGGRVLVTPSVRELPIKGNAALLNAVQTFSDFNSENDPHQQHDFGVIEIAGQTYFWKIDYYDKACEFGSEDPADPEKTTRVLTIMRADEY
jgi:predicted  nucleic acid-binding Zn-ribbon protein